MIEPNHSPAPWTQAGGAIRDANGYLIAEVLHAAGEAQGRANEQLIRRAPDLLGALKRLSFAAACRDNVMGDPSRLLQAKAELASAAEHAEAIIKDVEARR